MTTKRMPAFRMTFKAKDGTKYDIGTVWPATKKDGDAIDGLFSVNPETQNVPGQYPKMDAEEAYRRRKNGEGWIDLSVARPKSSGAAKQPGGQARHTDEWSSGGRDDDLPF